MNASDFWPAIHEAPDDDAPRLVYADWLDEHGGEPECRAEFIRLQVRAAALDEDHPEHLGIWDRINDIRDRNEERWLASLLEEVPGEEGKRGYIVTWRRGFVYWLQLHAAEGNSLELLDSFLTEHPVEELGLTPAGGPIDELGQAVARCSRLDALRELILRRGDGALQPATMGALGKASHLARLRRLNLSGDLDRAGVRALAESPLLARITDLSFDVEDGVGEEAVALLIAEGRSVHLEGLAMGSCYIGDRGLRLLSESPDLPALRRLDLGNNNLTSRGVYHLARSPLLGRLHRLDLGINDLNRIACRHLGRSPGLANVVELDLSHNDLQPEGIEVLLPGVGAGSLHSLDLSYTRLDAETAALLARCERLSGLRHLDLAGNPIGDAGLAALASSPYLGNLRELELYNTGVGAEGARALARSKRLGKLTDVCMQEEGIPEVECQMLRDRFGSGVLLM